MPQVVNLHLSKFKLIRVQHYSMVPTSIQELASPEETILNCIVVEQCVIYSLNTCTAFRYAP